MSAPQKVSVKPMTWPGFQPICHEPGCENAAKWHVFFPYYEQYRCDEHKPAAAEEREQELAEANARAARLERVLYPPGDSPQRDDASGEGRGDVGLVVPAESAPTGVPHLARACELLWQAGHPAIAEALQHEVAAAVREAAELREALRVALDCKGSYGGTVSSRGGDPALCVKCADLARAALEATDER